MNAIMYCTLELTFTLLLTYLLVGRCYIYSDCQIQRKRNFKFLSDFHYLSITLSFLILAHRTGRIAHTDRVKEEVERDLFFAPLTWLGSSHWVFNSNTLTDP